MKKKQRSEKARKKEETKKKEKEIEVRNKEETKFYCISSRGESISANLVCYKRTPSQTRS